MLESPDTPFIKALHKQIAECERVFQRQLIRDGQRALKPDLKLEIEHVLDDASEYLADQIRFLLNQQNPLIDHTFDKLGMAALRSDLEQILWEHGVDTEKRGG